MFEANEISGCEILGIHWSSGRSASRRLRCLGMSKIRVIFVLESWCYIIRIEFCLQRYLKAQIKKWAEREMGTQSKSKVSRPKSRHARTLENHAHRRFSTLGKCNRPMQHQKEYSVWTFGNQQSPLKTEPQTASDPKYKCFPHFQRNPMGPKKTNLGNQMGQRFSVRLYKAPVWRLTEVLCSSKAFTRGGRLRHGGCALQQDTVPTGAIRPSSWKPHSVPTESNDPYQLRATVHTSWQQERAPAESNSRSTFPQRSRRYWA